MLYRLCFYVDTYYDPMKSASSDHSAASCDIRRIRRSD